MERRGCLNGIEREETGFAVGASQPSESDKLKVAFAVGASQPSESEEVRTQLCNLKYKCATSLSILLVLLLEAIVRRIEEALRK